ncbi:hypothetical protein Dimus_003704 [Dionaea muscipula]
MKNVTPQFRKREIARFVDLTYMKYLVKRKKINLPRLIIRHMAHVINTPKHELLYREILTAIFKAFSVPLSKKDEKRPVDTDFFKKAFLNMCGLKRENGVWWLVVAPTEEEMGRMLYLNRVQMKKRNLKAMEESTPAGSKGQPSDSDKEVEDAKENSEYVDDF